jgi:hypothetical protein
MASVNNPGQQPTVKNEQFYQVLFKLQGSRDIQNKVKDLSQDQRKLLNTIFYKLSKNEDVVLTKAQESVFEQIKTAIDRTSTQKKTQSVFERFANTVKTVLAFRVSSEHVIGNINKLHERLHSPLKDFVKVTPGRITTGSISIEGELPAGLTHAKVAAIDQALTGQDRFNFRAALKSVIDLNSQIKSKEAFIAGKRSEIHAVKEGRGDEKTKNQQIMALEKVIEDAEKGSVDKKNRPLDGIKQFKERLETAENTLKEFIVKAEAAKVTVTDKKAEQKLHDEIGEEFKKLDKDNVKYFDRYFEGVLKQKGISSADLLNVSIRLDPDQRARLVKNIARTVQNEIMSTEANSIGAREILGEAKKTRESLNNEFSFLRQYPDLKEVKAGLKQQLNVMQESVFNKAFDKLFLDPQIRTSYSKVPQDKRESFITDLKSLLPKFAENTQPITSGFSRQGAEPVLTSVQLEAAKAEFLKKWAS